LDARLLTRLTNVALIAVVGMGTGHLLFPARADAPPAARAGFVAALSLAGALAARRERDALAWERGSTPRGAPVLWLVGGALAALLLAALAFRIVHGP
jgi:hypothetical protein